MRLLLSAVLTALLLFVMAACDGATTPDTAAPEVADAASKAEKVLVCHNAIDPDLDDAVIDLISVPASTVDKHVAQHGDCICDPDKAGTEGFCAKGVKCDSELDLLGEAGVADGCEISPCPCWWEIELEGVTDSNLKSCTVDEGTAIIESHQWVPQPGWTSQWAFGSYRPPAEGTSGCFKLFPVDKSPGYDNFFLNSNTGGITEEQANTCIEQIANRCDAISQ